MMSEKERLFRMFEEQKITEDDYRILSEAINKKTSFWNTIFGYVINPFQRIAGGYSLLAGIITIIILSILGVIANVYFPGVLSCLNASAVKNPNIEVNFFGLLYQNCVSWFVLSTLFILMSFLFKQKRLRIIDFFGTTALARFPYLFLTGYLALIRSLDPNFLALDFTKGLDFHPSITKSIFGLILIVCVIWQIITYFYALKESSGLSGKKLWGGFIVSIVLGEMISFPLAMLFV